MRTRSRKATVPSKAALGETIDLTGTSYLLRLPDGTVVSGRGSYTMRHTGVHAFLIDGTEHTVTVPDHEPGKGPGKDDQ